VQNRALFRDVDPFAAKHGVHSCSQAGLFSELTKKLECFVCDTVLGVIEVQAHSLDRHALTTLGIVRKQLPQVQLRGSVVV
jgi:hypothetical protein